MNQRHQQMIASIVKEKRRELNYTQQELADISNVSLRSIQRIEKGEVIPRMFTLKALASTLNFTLDFLNQSEGNELDKNKENRTRKMIISVFLVILSLLLATAYIFQSSNFPETSFELIIYYASVLFLLFLLLMKIWRKNNSNSNL